MEWCLQCKDNWNRYRTLNIHFYSTSVQKCILNQENTLIGRLNGSSVINIDKFLFINPD